jgi:hypothetical protein
MFIDDLLEALQGEDSAVRAELTAAQLSGLLQALVEPT